MRIVGAFALAALTAGCFQPLYGDRAAPGTSATANVRDMLAAVDVKQIEAPNGTPEARLAVEVRNALVFDLTGGGGAASPTHVLTVRLASTRQTAILDRLTARADVESYGIDATYSLADIASGREVMKGKTFTRVTFDIPGQQPLSPKQTGPGPLLGGAGQQRFARLRGLRDAEDRAAKTIAEHIRNRLASYFVAGT
jgi:LPS-assembly lipoprotein